MRAILLQTISIIAHGINIVFVLSFKLKPVNSSVNRTNFVSAVSPINLKVIYEQYIIIISFDLMKDCSHLFFLALIIVANNNSISASLSSYRTLAQAVTYTYNFTFSSITITASSSPTLYFSNNFNLNSNSVANCMFITSSAATSYSATACSVVANTTGYCIDFPSIYTSTLSSQTFLGLNFNMQNPWAATTQVITISILNSGGTTLASSSNSIVFTAASLNSCQWASSTAINGDSTTRTITFLPSAQVFQTSYIQITMPIWFGTTSNVVSSTTLGCSGINNVDTATPSCSKSPSGSNQIFTIPNLFTNNKTVSGAVVIQMSSLYNPWSLFTLSPIKYELYNNFGGTPFVSQSCSGLTQTTTTLNSLLSFSLVPSSLSISFTTTNKFLTFKNRNPIPLSGGQLQITWSSGVTITFNGTGATLSSQNSTTLVLNVKTTINANTTTSFNGFNIANPKSTRPFTITLTTLYKTGAVSYGIDFQTNTLQCTSGTLTSASVTVLSYYINAITTYTISFTTANALTSGSFIQISFPNQLSVSGSCSSSNGQLTCSISNSSYANISVSGSIPALTALTIVFNSVKNPRQVLTTSSIVIITYYDSGLDSIVDLLTSGLTITAVANQLSNVYITASSYTTYSPASLQFLITLIDSILTNGYISIQFPSAFTLNTVSLLAASFSNTTCSVSQSGNTVNINACFASDLSAQSISFTMSGFSNPNSLQTTSSFVISTYGPIGLINYVNSGLQIKMTTAATSTNLTLTPQISTVHAYSLYTVSLTFFGIHSSGDYLLMSIPASMAFSAGITCSGISGISLGCSSLNATTLNITINIFISLATQFSIADIRNYDISNSNVAFSIAVYSSSGYQMEQTQAASASYTAATISTYSVVSNNQLVLYQASNITLVFSAPFNIDSSFATALTSVSVTLPVEFSVSSNTSCSCNYGTGCTLVNSTTFLVSSPGNSLSNVTVTFSNVNLPFFSVSSSFGIYYNYNGLSIASVGSGVVVTAYCTSPCGQCITPTVCLSCLPSPNTYNVYFAQNNTCLSSCPSTYFLNATVCSTCISPCVTCNSSSFCFSCANNSFFYSANNTCLGQCPSGYYNNTATYNCTLCSQPCSTCLSSSLCASCSTGFLSNYTCVNSSACPNTTYPNATTMTCSTCSSPCSTCSLAQLNCTSCLPTYFFYNNICTNTCPNQMYVNSSSCDNCQLPCGNCSSLNYCLSCISSFLYNGSCYNSSLCPVGTFADSTNNNCSGCTNNCSSCSYSSVNCTACSTPLFYYNAQCLSVCPSQMYGSGTICVNCSNPCGNCSNATFCLSCLSNYLSSGSCVSSSNCPNGTYAETANNTCSLCPSQCANCLSLVNCSSCSLTYFYFSYQCLSSCPNGTYPSSAMCLNCSSVCSTCSSGSSFNCTSCPLGQILYNNTCLTGCIPGTFNSSGQCQNCDSNCSTCVNSSTCSSCNGSLYLYNYQCTSLCPIGTFTTLNICGACSGLCLSCLNNADNCTSCNSSLVFYTSTCLSNCPTNYFNIGGICKTCSNCNSCIDISHCSSCYSNYYLYSGVCYSSCPAAAPVGDPVAFTCSQCGASCSTCNSGGNYCFTCSSGYLMLSGTCYTSCPSGYSSDYSTNTCVLIKVLNLVYYPFTIGLGILMVIIAYSKFKFVHSDAIGNLTALIGLASIFSLIVLIFPTYSSYSTRLLTDAGSSVASSTLTLLLGMGIAILGASLLLGLIFNVVIYKKFEKDNGLKLWKKHSAVNRYAYNTIVVLSSFNLAIYRIIYSKLFLRQCLSCYFKANYRLLFISNVFTVITILTNSIPSIALSISVILMKQGDSQTQIYAVDNLIVSSIFAVAMLTDTASRDSSDFEMMLEDFPFLKKVKKYDDLDSSGSLISIVENESIRCKTEIDPKERYNYLNKVSLNEQMGNFGALNHMEAQVLVQDGNCITKTLPEFNKITGDISFNPFQLKQINDDLFFKEPEYTKKFNEIKQDYNKNERFEQIQEQDVITKHNQQLFKDNSVHQIINRIKKPQDPQQYLNKFRSQDYEEIDEENMSHLLDLAHQNGIDLKYVKEVLAKKKYYNHQILTEIMGNSEQVSPEAIQQLLKSSNNTSKLRQILGRQSTIDTEKLKQILSDKDYKEIIESMFNQESGFLSTEAIKQLLANNKKYHKDFIINLLNNRTIEKDKLRRLILSNKEGELDTLKMLKHLGGDKLQNLQRLENMLGRQSDLNPVVIPKIVNQMTEQSTSNIFDKKSTSNKTIIKKVINNKSINLTELNPINQMPEIIQEFAQLLTCGNQQLEQSILELLEGNQYDGEALKRLVQQSGNSQEEMANLMKYIEQNKKKRVGETPIGDWPQDDEQDKEDKEDDIQSSMPSLDISITHEKGEKRQRNRLHSQINNDFKDEFQPESGSKLKSKRFRHQEPEIIHLPSEQIYLQRITGPHELQKNKKFRKNKKKVTKQINKAMDEDNQVFDLDF